MKRFLAPLASVLFAFLAWPVHAMAKAGVRFVHAVPGAGNAELTVEQAGRTTALGMVGYGEATEPRDLEAGPVDWELKAGRNTVASGSATLSDGGRYTAVAVPRGLKLGVELFRDATRVARDKALVRVIHASPEFGTPDLQVDGERVASKLAFGKATPFLTLVPGRHDLEAVRTGTNDTLLGRSVRIPGGSTTNAIVIGTQGAPARIITVSDQVNAKASTSTMKRAQRTTGASTGGGSVKVGAGDSLWSIAQGRLGSDASNASVAREVQRIWNLNASRVGSGDPNLIFPGQTLQLG